MLYYGSMAIGMVKSSEELVRWPEGFVRVLAVNPCERTVPIGLHRPCG